MKPPAPVTSTERPCRESGGSVSPIVVSRNLTARLRRRASRLLGRGGTTRYEPAAFWESRAHELIEGYDHPETWAERGWVRAGVEEEAVVDVLRENGVRSVVVPGAGSGRQYAYLLAAGFETRGFDISPSLVAACRERYPDVQTELAGFPQAADRLEPADAVLSVNVLQHVPPADLDAAVAAVSALARRVVVLRELTEVPAPSSYQFAHDYAAAFAGWELLRREPTDERPGVRVELLAWRRHG